MVHGKITSQSRTRPQTLIATLSAAEDHKKPNPSQVSHSANQGIPPLLTK
jgi:hypothetical protein